MGAATVDGVAGVEGVDGVAGVEGVVGVVGVDGVVGVVGVDGGVGVDGVAGGEGVGSVGVEWGWRVTRIATTTAIREARKAIERAEEALGSEIGALLAELDHVRAQYEGRIAALTERHAVEMAGAKRVQEQLAQTHRRIVGQLTEKIRTLEAEPRNSEQIST